MKTTAVRFILAALAATVTLAACTKDVTPPNSENDKINPASEGSRVIAVSFSPQTKTSLEDGFQPVFEDGDKILVANGQDQPDTCVVSVKGDKASISTNLTGTLTAVYPAKAAKMNGDKPCQIDSVLVSTEQDGTFASANICMAVMKDEKDESLSFENRTAVFCITPAAGNNTQYVELSAEGFDIANDVPTGATHTSLETIHVTTTSADSVWVSILIPNGLKVGDLSFYDGTNVKTITGDKATELVKVSTLYTVNDEGWKNPEADIPDGALKGVFTVSDNGTPTDTTDDIKVHFSQGNLRYVVKTNKWSFYEHQYDFCNTKTYTGHHSDTISLFTWGYDAAKSIVPDGTGYVEGHTTDGETFDKTEDWGSQIGDGNTWRTLTTAEWQYLFSYDSYTNEIRKDKYKWGVTVCGIANCVVLLPDGWTWDANTVGSGWQTDGYPEEKNNNEVTWEVMEKAGAVCFPTTGYRNGSDISNDFSFSYSYGYYWSSSAADSDKAYMFCLFPWFIQVGIPDNRNGGFSVRLVTDVSAAPTPETDAEIFIIATDNENGINPTSFCVKSSDRDFTYWIGRTASEKACTVPIINHSDSRFTVPSSVTFQAGEAQAPLTITFSDTLPEEEDCTVSFEIGGEYAAGSGSFAGVLKYIPFYKRVCGNYTSDEIISYFGDKVTFNFNVVPSEDDSTGKVIFENLDPISFGSGGTAENGYNKPYGLLDEENSMITIPVQGFGYESWDFLGFDAPTLDESEYYYTPIYIRFDGNDTLTFTNAWGIITDPEAWEYWSFYNGGFSCKKTTANIQKSASCNVTPMTLPSQPRLLPDTQGRHWLGR